MTNVWKDSERHLIVAGPETARFVLDEDSGYYYVIIQSTPKQKEKKMTDIHGHYIYDAVFVYNFISKSQLHILKTHQTTVLAVNKVDEILEQLHKTSYRTGKYWRTKALKTISIWIEQLLGEGYEVAIDDEEYTTLDSDILGKSMDEPTHHIYIVRLLTNEERRRRYNRLHNDDD